MEILFSPILAPSPTANNGHGDCLNPISVPTRLRCQSVSLWEGNIDALALTRMQPNWVSSAPSSFFFAHNDQSKEVEMDGGICTPSLLSQPHPASPHLLNQFSLESSWKTWKTRICPPWVGLRRKRSEFSVFPFFLVHHVRISRVEHSVLDLEISRASVLFTSSPAVWCRSGKTNPPRARSGERYYSKTVCV